MLLTLLLACPAPTDQTLPDADRDGYATDVDCDDAAADVHPGATEACNDIDDDCNGRVDDEDPALDASTALTAYPDGDGDGYGRDEAALQRCVIPAGSSAQGGDCDDEDAAIHPDAAELCGSIDENCNGLLDDDDPAVDPASAGSWYSDADGDGFGDATTLQVRCEAPVGTVADLTDCDDTSLAVNPDATELCNGFDDDCDGAVDDADESLDPGTAIQWYADRDGDFYGDPAASSLACVAPEATSAVADDCDDTNAAVHPNASEVCNDIDDDCNAQADDADPALDLASASTWYQDADADGYGDATVAGVSCTAPAGFVADATDCDDASGVVSPAATEVCNSLDDDCDTLIDDADSSLDLTAASTWYTDADGDGAGDPASPVVACAQPAGAVAAGDDCDAADASVAPGLVDTCGDGIDQDCTGADRACGGLSGTYDADADADFTLYTELGSYLGGRPGILDWDGDGQDDLVAGAPYSDYADTNGGRVFIHLGPLPTGTRLDTDGDTASLVGSTMNAQVGSYVDRLGDLDGDGDDELWVAGNSTSTTALLEWGVVPGGSVSGDVAMTSALVLNKKCYVAAGGDPDGDGMDGWWCRSMTSSVEWYEGMDSSASFTITGPDGNFGGAMVATEDMDGDGVEDLLAGDVSVTGAASNAGRVYFFPGPVASASYTTATATYSGVSRDDYLGAGLQVGDFNGDGTPDVLAGSTYNSTLATSGGAWYGFLGPPTGALTSASADFATYGDATNLRIGSYDPGVADLDLDGTDDVAFGCSAEAGAGTSRGAVWLFYGPLSGTVALSDASVDGAYIEGSEDNAALGNRVVLGGDLTGEGTPELLVGAYGASWGGTTMFGKVYLFEGG